MTPKTNEDIRYLNELTKVMLEEAITTEATTEKQKHSQLEAILLLDAMYQDNMFN